MTRVCFASLLSILGLVPAHAFSQDHVIGVGAEVHWDDGELDGEERVALTAPKQEDRSFEREESTAFALWYLYKATESLRVGGGVRYYGTYSLLDEVPEDTREEDLPEPEEFGDWLELYGQVEWHTPLVASGAMEFVLGAQAGVIEFFPGGALEEEIRRLQEQNAGVWDAPRLGFMFGPQVGVRYQALELLALRLDLGVRYNRVFLFSTSEEVDGVAFSKQWSLNVLRYAASLGAEVTF